MRVKVNEGKTKDVSVIDVHPYNYIVPSNEQHLYHCIIEVRKFDSETGKRLSVPRIQKFGKKTFENLVSDALKKQGYTITVLHDPNEYIKAQADAKSAADAKAKADAEEEAKAKAKEALKAEILAELEAAGVIPEKQKDKAEENTKKETEN